MSENQRRRIVMKMFLKVLGVIATVLLAAMASLSTKPWFDLARLTSPNPTPTTDPRGQRWTGEPISVVTDTSSYVFKAVPTKENWLVVWVDDQGVPGDELIGPNGHKGVDILEGNPRKQLGKVILFEVDQNGILFYQPPSLK
jgi:hypothetical protein